MPISIMLQPPMLMKRILIQHSIPPLWKEPASTRGIVARVTELVGAEPGISQPCLMVPCNQFPMEKCSGSSLPDRLPTACPRSEEHTSELQSLRHLVCRLLLEK